MNPENIKAFAGNRIIQLLIGGGSFSDTSLKKAYYQLSKACHPDSPTGSNEDFIHLSEEFEQAKEGLPWLCEYFTQFNSQKEEEIIDLAAVRLAFYMSLRRYTVAGLYSVKVRIRESLRQRNKVILEEVVKKAGLYDKSFVGIFLNFNRNHLKRYSLWLSEKNFKNGRHYFIKGLGFFFDYELRGSREMYNICRSYLRDAEYELKHSPDSPISSSMLSFARWLLAELEKDSLHTELLSNSSSA